MHGRVRVPAGVNASAASSPSVAAARAQDTSQQPRVHSTIALAHEATSPANMANLEIALRQLLGYLLAIEQKMVKERTSDDNVTLHSVFSRANEALGPAPTYMGPSSSGEDCDGDDAAPLLSRLDDDRLGLLYTRSSDPVAIKSQICKLLAKGKKLAAMESARTGVREDCPALSDEFIGKFYPTRSPERDTSNATKMPVDDSIDTFCDQDVNITMGDMEAVLRRKKASLARPYDFMSWAQALELAKREETKKLLFDITRVLADNRVQKYFTVEECELFLVARGVIIPKAGPRRGWRPIGICNVLLTLADSAMLVALGETLKKACLPNLGYGVPGATELLPRLIDLMLEDPDMIVLPMDIENAFNSIEHDVILNSVYELARANPKFRVLARSARNMYANVARMRIVYTCGRTGKQVTRYICRGVIQGSATGSVLFIIALNHLLQPFFDKYEPKVATAMSGRVLCRGYSDDQYLMMKMSEVLEAAALYDACVRIGGLKRAVTKSVPSGQPLAVQANRDIFRSMGVKFPNEDAGVAYDRAAHDLTVSCGVPIGHPTLVRQHVSKVVSNLITTLDSLGGAACLPNKAMRGINQRVVRAIRLAVGPSVIHLLRALPPKIVRAEVARLDAATVKVLFDILGISNLLNAKVNGDEADADASSPFMDCSPAWQADVDQKILDPIRRIFLPSALGGLAVHNLHLIAPSCFIGSLALTGSRLAAVAPCLLVPAPASLDAAPADASGDGTATANAAANAAGASAPAASAGEPEATSSAVAASPPSALTTGAPPAPRFLQGGALLEGISARVAILASAGTLPRKGSRETAAIAFLENFDPLDATVQPVRKASSIAANLLHQGVWQRIFVAAPKAEKLEMLSTRNPNAGAFLDAAPPLWDVHGRTGLLFDDDLMSETLRHRVGLPPPEQMENVAAGWRVAAPPNCHLCTKPHDRWHETTCSGTHKASFIHNRVRDNLMELAKRSRVGSGLEIRSEPKLDVYYTRQQNQNDTDRTTFRRSDFIVASGTVPQILAEVKVYAVAAEQTLARVPDSCASTEMDAIPPKEYKKCVTAVSRLNPFPALPTPFIPGLAIFRSHDYTPATAFGEMNTIDDQYCKRFSNIDTSKLFVAAFDTAGFMSPRANFLRRQLCRDIEENNRALGREVEPWFVTYRNNAIDISAIIHRGCAVRRIECRRLAYLEDRRRANPSSYLGPPAPPTKGAAGAALRAAARRQQQSAAAAGVVAAVGGTMAAPPTDALDPVGASSAAREGAARA